jgi:hypothetical protein
MTLVAKKTYLHRVIYTKLLSTQNHEKPQKMFLLSIFLYYNLCLKP